MPLGNNRLFPPSVPRATIDIMKRALKIAAKETMQKHGYDPLEVLVLHAQDPATTPQQKLEVAGILLPYMYPKLSNIAIEAEVNSNVTADSQAELLRRVLENPELADAAQKLSLAASEAMLMSGVGADEESSGLVN